MKLDFLTPDQWKKLLVMHSEMARRMGRGFLLCRNCGHRQPLTPSKVDEYFEHGWPVCCEGTLDGGTMHYFLNEQNMRKELKVG